MNTKEMIERFGLTPTINEDYLARLYWAFEGAQTLLDSEVADEAKKSREILRNEIRKDADSKYLADVFEENVRKSIFAGLDGFPNASVFLVSILNDILDDVKDVERVVLDKLERSTQKVATTSSEVQEAREIASWAKDALTNVWSTFLLLNGEHPEWMPVKTNKAGEVMPALSNVKRSDSEESTQGRPTITKMFRFFINDEEIPQGLDRHEIAVRYCSTPLARLNGKRLQEMIDKENEGKKMKETETFSLNVPTGILRAETVQK